MKRSEILDVLQIFFESDCAFESPHDAMISASRVLTIVEDCGMLPPTFIKTQTINLYGSDVEVTKLVNEWE